MQEEPDKPPTDVLPPELEDTDLDRWPELSEREVEVAELLARGANGHEISLALGINIKTYSTHRGHIMKKLGIKNAVQLAHMATKRGTVFP